MAQIGAAVAAGASAGKTALCGCDVRFTRAHSLAFRADAEKRDFVCAGAAAGVAAAFNAPAGAVLFVLEEAGVAHWHRSLLWRAFAAAAIAAFVIDFTLSGLEGGSWGRLTVGGMFSFGLPGAEQKPWGIVDVPLFAALGVVGGLLGGAFNRLNEALTAVRLAHVAPRRVRRLVDTLAVTLLAGVVAFAMPALVGACAPVPAAFAGAPNPAAELVALYCGEDQFNDLASLWLVSPEVAIRSLFHMPSGSFVPAHLALFALTYLALMCLASGTSVPSGLFIPSLLAGSALGRFVGELAAAHAPSGTFVDAGTFAVVGAAAMLGGILRMSISMAVILLESTGNTLLLLPLIVTLMAARVAGNALSRGLYDAHIALRAWPVLEERLPKPLAFGLRVRDVLAGAPVVLAEIETAGALLDTLRAPGHAGVGVVFRPATRAPWAARASPSRRRAARSPFATTATASLTARTRSSRTRRPSTSSAPCATRSSRRRRRSACT
jgi:chloride channel 7